MTGTDSIQSMNQHEYAAFEKATTDDTILSKDGFWWRQVRKGFFRPLCPFFPMRKALGRDAKPFGIVQYALSDPAQSNSILNMIMFDHPERYDLAGLPGDVRRSVRRAREHAMTVERIADPDILIKHGGSVYQSFVKRTGYVYDKKRLDASYFKRWIRTLYDYPKIRVHGVFREGNLVSFMIEALVEDVLVIKAMINAPDALKLHAPDLQLHHARMRAKEHGRIRTIYNGYYAQVQGLNKFKLHRGADLWFQPARIDAPFPVLGMIQWLFPEQSRYLKGFGEQELIPSREPN